MKLSTGIRLSLVLRMVVALVALAVTSAFVAGTAVVVSGGLVWLAAVLVVAVLEVTLLPVIVGEQFVVLGVVVARTPEIVLVAGALLVPALYYRPVVEEIEAFRAELKQTGDPASERDPQVSTAARRLAKQAGIPEPEVFIANRRRPESYAVGSRSDGTIVVTRGLVRQLSDDQLEAVLAHEISHLANGDCRVMNLALVPMLVVERLGSDDPPDWIKRGIVLPVAYLAHLLLWALLSVVVKVQALNFRLGIAYLSRGRELAADRGAAKLTGSPGALASALQTLDDERGPPSEDLRDWRRTASALDILPHEAATSRRWTRTHPSTETRIEQLEALAVEQSSDGQ